MTFRRILSTYWNIAASLICTASGSFSLLFYLRTVDTGASWFLLYLGSLSLSIGILLSYFWMKDENDLVFSSRQIIFALVIIFLTSLTLNLLNSMRWEVLSGADVLWEYRAARDVVADGWWNWRLANDYRYFSSLSISIFPAIFSEITDLNLLHVFSYVLPALCAMVPVFIFLLVNQTFRRPQLAFLSAIIYAESYFTIPSFGREIKRQPIAIIFLLCSLVILSRLMEEKSGWHARAARSTGEKHKLILLLAVFSFGLVVSHYTMSFFLLAILGVLCLGLAAFYTIKPLLKKILRVEIPSARQIRVCVLYFVFLAALVIGWNMLLSPQYTVQYVDYLESMLTGGFGKRYITQLETAVVFEVLGPIVTPWLFFVLGLGIVGFLVLLRTQKDINQSIILLIGGLFFAMYPLWIIRSSETSWYMSLTRFIGVSFIFLCIFSAYALFRADKKTRSILTVLFVLLNLPINALLPVYSSYVLYSREQTVPVEMAIRQLYSTQQDFEVDVWISNSINPGEIISTDTPGTHRLFYSNNIYAEVVNASYGNGKSGNIMSFRPFKYFTKQELHGVKSKYLFLNYFAVQYGQWYVAGPARDFRTSRVNMTDLLSFSNKVYDDGRSNLLVKR